MTLEKTNTPLVFRLQFVRVFFGQTSASGRRVLFAHWLGDRVVCFTIKCFAICARVLIIEHLNNQAFLTR